MTFVAFKILFSSDFKLNQSSTSWQKRQISHGNFDDCELTRWARKIKGATKNLLLRLFMKINISL